MEGILDHSLGWYSLPTPAGAQARRQATSPTGTLNKRISHRTSITSLSSTIAYRLSDFFFFVLSVVEEHHPFSVTGRENEIDKQTSSNNNINNYNYYYYYYGYYMPIRNQDGIAFFPHY
jgi:hypothetical protein